MYFSDLLGPQYIRHPANDRVRGYNYCDEQGPELKFVPALEDTAYSLPVLSHKPAHITSRRPTLYHTYGPAVAHPRTSTQHFYAPSSNSHIPPAASFFQPHHEHIPTSFAAPTPHHLLRRPRTQVLPHNHYSVQPYGTDLEEEEGDIVYVWDETRGQPRAMRLTPMHDSSKVRPTTAQDLKFPATQPQGGHAEPPPKTMNCNASSTQVSRSEAKEELLKQQLWEKVSRMIEEAMSAQQQKPSHISLSNSSSRSRSPSPPPPTMLSSHGHLASAKGSDQQTERVALQDTIRSAVGATTSRQDAKQIIPVKLISTLGNDKAAGPLPGPLNPAPASSKKQLHLTRSQAARIVQKWWRGWRVWGLQREAIKTLRTAAAMLWKASALLEDSLAGQSTLTQKQYMEVSDLAVKVVMQLDGLVCSSPELRAVKKRLTNSALALEDKAQSTYIKPLSPQVCDPEPSPLSISSTPREGNSSSSSSIDEDRQISTFPEDKAVEGETKEEEEGKTQFTDLPQLPARHTELEDEISFRQLEGEVNQLDTTPTESQEHSMDVVPDDSRSQHDHAQGPEEAGGEEQGSTAHLLSQVPVYKTGISTSIIPLEHGKESTTLALAPENDQYSTVAMKEDRGTKRERRLRVRLLIEDEDET